MTMPFTLPEIPDIDMAEIELTCENLDDAKQSTDPVLFATAAVVADEHEIKLKFSAQPQASISYSMSIDSRSARALATALKEMADIFDAKQAQKGSAK